MRSHDAVQAELAEQFGLTTPNLEVGLSQDDLFHAAIANDRGRVHWTAVRRPEGLPDIAWCRRSARLLQRPDVHRSPGSDTFCVARESLDTVWWKHGFSKFDPRTFDACSPRVIDHLNAGRNLYVTDVFCGWDPNYSEPYRFVGEYATHAYFCNIMFPQDVRDDSDRAETGWTIVNVPSFLPTRTRRHEQRRGVIMDIANRVASSSAGRLLRREQEDDVHVMNYVLPAKGQLTMHCSANVGDTTTRRSSSASPAPARRRSRPTPTAAHRRRRARVDRRGISNFEDGCYAKLIDLDKKAEPVIAAAMSMKGTLIENVPPLPGKPIEETDPRSSTSPTGRSPRTPASPTRSTATPACAEGAKAAHPETIVLLTADAFGVLPPVSILDNDEVMYHFVMGFTSKLAGTEVGVTEPQPPSRRASAPVHVAEGLGLRRASREADGRAQDSLHPAQHRLERRPSRQGRAHVAQGHPSAPQRCARTAISTTPSSRSSRSSASDPTAVAGVDSHILNPRNTWDDPEAYDEAAAEMLKMFHAEFESNGYAELGIAPKM